MKKLTLAYRFFIFLGCVIEASLIAIISISGLLFCSLISIVLTQPVERLEQVTVLDVKDIVERAYHSSLNTMLAVIFCYALTQLMAYLIKRRQKKLSAAPSV